MTPIQRYLAEEVALDHADGLIPRREALRRLALLGLGLPAATALLAACGAPEEPAAAPSPASPAPTTTPSASPAGPSPLPTEAITFAGPEGTTLQAAWAAAAGDAKGAVLVIHENRGLTDHIRSVAGRLAAGGYSALALDLLSREGGTASFTDTAAATAKLGEIPPERFVADMKAAVGELGRCPGRLCGAGRPGERQQGRGPCCPGEGRADPRDRDVPRGGARVLQRHGAAVQPAGGGAGVRTCPVLVRPPPVLTTRPLGRSHATPRVPSSDGGEQPHQGCSGTLRHRSRPIGGR